VKRRAFISLLGGAAAWPLVARAQQGERARRIGVLMAYADSDAEAQAWVAAFREGLQKLGWTEGRDVAIDVRWATGETEAIQLRKNSSRQDPKSFWRQAHLLPRRCFNKRGVSQSFLRSFPIRSAAASWQASRGRVGM
jgi:hypothetical protein